MGFVGLLITEISQGQSCRGRSAVLCGWNHLASVSIQSLKERTLSSKRYSWKYILLMKLYTYLYL